MFVLFGVALVAAYLGGFNAGRQYEARDMRRINDEVVEKQMQVERKRAISRCKWFLGRIDGIVRVTMMETDWESRAVPGTSLKLQVLIEPDASESLMANEARRVVGNFLPGLHPSEVDFSYRRAQARWTPSTIPPPGTGFDFGEL